MMLKIVLDFGQYWGIFTGIGILLNIYFGLETRLSFGNRLVIPKIEQKRGNTTGEIAQIYVRNTLYRVFGDNPFSLKSFFKSILFSLVSIVAILLLLSSNDSTIVDRFISIFITSPNSAYLHALSLVVFLFIEWISFFQTFLFIKYAVNSKSKYEIIFLLYCDIVLTVNIFVFLFPICLIILAVGAALKENEQYYYITITPEKYPIRSTPFFYYGYPTDGYPFVGNSDDEDYDSDKIKSDENFDRAKIQMPKFEGSIDSDFLSSKFDTYTDLYLLQLHYVSIIPCAQINSTRYSENCKNKSPSDTIMIKKAVSDEFSWPVRIRKQSIAHHIFNETHLIHEESKQKLATDKFYKDFGAVIDQYSKGPAVISLHKTDASKAGYFANSIESAEDLVIKINPIKVFSNLPALVYLDMIKLMYVLAFNSSQNIQFRFMSDINYLQFDAQPLLFLRNLRLQSDLVYQNPTFLTSPEFFNLLSERNMKAKVINICDTRIIYSEQINDMNFDNQIIMLNHSISSFMFANSITAVSTSILFEFGIFLFGSFSITLLFYLSLIIFLFAFVIFRHINNSFGKFFDLASEKNIKENSVLLICTVGGIPISLLFSILNNI